MIAVRNASRSASWSVICGHSGGDTSPRGVKKTYAPSDMSAWTRTHAVFAVSAASRADSYRIRLMGNPLQLREGFR